MEAVAERPDGARAPFMAFPTPLFDESGALTGAINALVDISERKSAEQDRRRLTAIFDSSEDAIISKDLRGIITSWNPGAERLFGYAAKEMIGKSITLLILAQLRQEEESILGRIAGGGRVEHFETTRVRKDGTPVRISLSVSPIRNSRGAVMGASKIARDITQRMTVEQAALVERTLQLALAERGALVGSFAYDPDTDRVQISEGYAAIHRLPNGTTEISRSEWQAVVHPHDRQRLEDLRIRAFRERWNEYSVDYRIVCRGGEVRWIDARNIILYRADGPPRRVVGINIDITERERGEEHQRALNAELDHRVKNLLATDNAIITQAPRPDSSLADFISSLDSRIKSLARTHELLSRRRWQDVSLAEIVHSQIEPYTGGNTDIDGPSVSLQTEAAQAIAMVLHELATNAAKHGAFSQSNGRVVVSWSWLPNGSHGQLALEWQEVDGPAVLSPRQPGYGTTIIRELIPFELGGTVNLVFTSEGLRCRMDIPGRWVAPTQQLGSWDQA
jgi:PAS domain S-box-containing protein